MKAVLNKKNTVGTNIEEMEGMDDFFISLYADDVNIAKAIKSTQDAATLQTAIDELKSWCDLNDLHLNLDKCPE